MCGGNDGLREKLRWMWFVESGLRGRGGDEGVEDLGRGRSGGWF